MVEKPFQAYRFRVRRVLIHAAIIPKATYVTLAYVTDKDRF